MLRAQRSWATVRDPQAAAAWLDRIVVNECRDRLRRRRVSRAIEAVGAVGADSMAPPDAMETSERAALRDALALLALDHRIVVVLRYLLDLPVDDIARRTGVPAGTVKSRLHHALRQLRAAFDAAARLDSDR
jgi:RNA polymerase sigma-70 factor (ECF subfamily)